MCFFRGSSDDAAEHRGPGHAADAEHVGSRPQADLPRRRELPDLLEGLAENPVEFLPHPIDTPLIVLPILHPLKPTGRHAAGVGEDVGEHGDVVAGEDDVGLRRHR